MHYRLMTIGITICLMAFNSHRKPGITNTPAAESCPYYYHQGLKKNVYTRVEIEAEFPGGVAAKQRFLNKNVRFPDFTDADLLQSNVNLSFIVDVNGKISEIEVKNKPDSSNYSALDKAYVQAVRTMPNWIPATCDGKPVACKSTLAIVVCFRGND